MTDLLVVGGSGLLGREVVRRAVLAGLRVTATHRRRPVAGVESRALDVRDRAAVADVVREVAPPLIVNAAYRQHDWATTADGAMHVAAAAARVHARLVHVSSDAVFSGRAVTYDEDATPDPITPYGAAKAAAELAVRGLTPDAVIARTSLIIGPPEIAHPRNVHTSTGTLFTDDIRCPVDVGDLAAALLELARSDHAGVHHVAGADAISRYELGVLISRRDGLDETALTPGRRTDAGPFDVRLDCRRTQRRLTTRLRGAREFLAPPDPAPSRSAAPRPHR